MAKFEKENSGGKKRMVISVLIVVLVLVAIAGGYFLYKSSSDKKVNQALVTGYSIGYNKSLEDVAQGQTQTGSILVWQNNSIQIVNIQDICNKLK
jgi:flagellar basal body-associated protein FliL